MKLSKPVNIDELRPQFQRAFEFGTVQLARMIPKWPVNKPAPIFTEEGIWTRPEYMWTDWCPGFYAGMMWLAFERTGEKEWRENAEKYTRALEHRKFDRNVHDLGFIFMSTADRWYRLLEDGDPIKQWLKDILVTAGTIQSFRWKDTGSDHYIYSFNGPQSLFIDIMMNIRVIFRAHQIGGSEELFDKAMTHARTTEKYLIQKDGPRLFDRDGLTVHEGIFNPARGEFRCLSTQQGYSPFTCWSRGLGWAMYGYVDTFLYTGDAFFLNVAERCAGYYLDNTPENGVPYWDYGAPGIPDEPLDSSAAAIAAGAFWKLKDLAVTRRSGDEYRNAALKILATLTGEEFRGKGEGILAHGVYHRPQGWGVDESVMWGEYFFMEALHEVLS